MTEQIFMLKSRMTAENESNIVPGNHIKLEGLVYERLSGKPRGKRIDRKLTSTESDTRILIYR